MVEGKQKAVRWPCGVCGRGVGNNSIECIVMVGHGCARADPT